jgi:DNA adenine methylase
MSRIADCDVSIEAWHMHRAIYNSTIRDYKSIGSDSLFELGFSTFFLSRTNRSGILPRAGMIGGKKQDGKYTLGVRFKKDVLIKRIQKIAEYRDRIVFSAHDALTFLENLHLEGVPVERCFVFLDPPYYKQGKALYGYYYTHENHVALANYLKDKKSYKWLLMYDDCGEVRALYNSQEVRVDGRVMQYSIKGARKATELVITPQGVICP